MQQLSHVHSQLRKPDWQQRAVTRVACVSDKSLFRTPPCLRRTAFRAPVQKSALPELTLQKLDTVTYTPEPQTEELRATVLDSELLLQGYAHDLGGT